MFLRQSLTDTFMPFPLQTSSNDHLGDNPTMKNVIVLFCYTVGFLFDLHFLFDRACTHASSAACTTQ